MRLWSIDPAYLDSRGIVALWREGLLARKVLEGKTKGYTNHPQLDRFKKTKDPLTAIDVYLEGVAKESIIRGYSFDTTKIRLKLKAPKIPVTEGQLAHELMHLKSKLEIRDPKRLIELNKTQKKTTPIRVHPLFRVVSGDIESWEKVQDTGNTFPYGSDLRSIDFKKNPELYRIGIGEQGVLMVEPYKSKILPHWRFKTPEIAETSAKKIYQLFSSYKKQKDFVGMDMARKYLQMGYTRSRRYANHASGRKYGKNGEVLPQSKDWADNEKAQSARIFYEYYVKAREDSISIYDTLRKDFKKKYG